jgi:hypothetical protein
MDTSKEHTDKLLSAEDFLLKTLNSEEKSLLVCGIYEDQRPLKGAAGILDWRLRGFISKFILNQKISGKNGELVYIPVQYQGLMRHVFLVGLGSKKNFSPDIQETTLKIVKSIAEQAKNLSFEKVALSFEDFGFIDQKKIQTTFKSTSQQISVEYIQ